MQTITEHVRLAGCEICRQQWSRSITLTLVGTHCHHSPLVQLKMFVLIIAIMIDRVLQHWQCVVRRNATKATILSLSCSLYYETEHVDKNRTEQNQTEQNKTEKLGENHDCSPVDKRCFKRPAVALSHTVTTSESFSEK